MGVLSPDIYYCLIKLKLDKIMIAVIILKAAIYASQNIQGSKCGHLYNWWLWNYLRSELVVGIILFRVCWLNFLLKQFRKKWLNIQTLYRLFYIYCKRLPKLFYKLSSSSCDNFSTSSPITLLSLKFSRSCSISSKWLSGSIWSFVFDDLLRITGLSGGGGIPASPNSSSTSPRSPKIGSHPGNPPTLWNPSELPPPEL